jgi:hypothetical protein
MPVPRVLSVGLPRQGLIAGALPRRDYADAFRVQIPPGCACASAVAQALFSTVPGWVEILLRLRNALVAPLGLKTGPAPQAAAPPENAITGQTGPLWRIGIFPVLACTPEEILMGEDDKHLNFRVSVLVEREGADNWAVVSTAVRFNNWLGRIYFVPVRPVHRVIVPAILRRGVRHLSA